jgi:hypothetical protein
MDGQHTAPSELGRPVQQGQRARKFLSDLHMDITNMRTVGKFENPARTINSVRILTPYRENSTMKMKPILWLASQQSGHHNFFGELVMFYCLLMCLESRITNGGRYDTQTASAVQSD